MRVDPPFPPGAVEEARKWPNGWVYEIDPEYAGIETVPGTAIRGAWKVDANGELTGEFEENPNYRGNASDDLLDCAGDIPAWSVVEASPALRPASRRWFGIAIKCLFVAALGLFAGVGLAHLAGWADSQLQWSFSALFVGLVIVYLIWTWRK